MRRDALVERLRASRPVIAPSLLQCDFGRLAEEVQRLEQAGAQVLHLDVMDGHFVPNLTYGPVVVEAVRKATSLPLDAHLMISEPGKYLDAFVRAGCDSVSIHVEAVPDPRPLLDRLRKLDVVAGLSLNPPTPIERISPFLSACDLVLIMSVMPGFGGQTFQESALEKVASLRARSGPLLEIDGGINRRTVPAAAGAGADMLVVGSAMFADPDYRGTLTELTRLACDAAGKQVTTP